MMVGINKSREHFARQDDRYAIVGGAARVCSRS